MLHNQIIQRGFDNQKKEEEEEEIQ